MVTIKQFTAAWCGPCRQIAPIVEEAKEKYSEKAIIEKVDVDQYPELSLKANIKGVPTFVVYNDKNEEMGRRSGAMAKTVFFDFVESFIK